MPILKRLQGDDDRPQDSAGRDPELIRGRTGHPSFSLAALRERIEAQFELETANRLDILLETQDEAARRALVREAGEYALAVESVPLAHAEKEALFDAVYRSLFTFGPLDALLEDDAVTGMTLDGQANVRVRRGMGEPETVSGPFHDARQLARVIERMLAAGGAQLLETEPFIEVGLTLLGRPARLSLVIPPLSPGLHLDVRLHPHTPTTLDALLEQGAISETDLAVLQALTRSEYGVLIVGEAAAGKTTLLEALLPHLPHPSACWLVERAREIRPPEGMNSLAAIPAREDRAGQSFAYQIAAALKESPVTLILDELRGDEAGPVWTALAAEGGPRCLFALRGSSHPHRLRNAVSLLIRKAQPNLEQAAINKALLNRLPFVIMTRIGTEGLRVTGIGEWTADPDSEEVTLASLVREGKATGHPPRHALETADDLWARG